MMSNIKVHRICDDFIQNLQPINYAISNLLKITCHKLVNFIKKSMCLIINSTTGWLTTPTALCFSLQSYVQSSNSYRIYKFKSIYSSVLFIAHNRAKIELISSKRKESKDTAQSEDFSSNEWLKVYYRQNFYLLRQWFDFTNFIVRCWHFFSQSTRAYHKISKLFWADAVLTSFHTDHRTKRAIKIVRDC